MLLTASNRSAIRASLRERGGYMDMGCCIRLAAGMWLDWDPDADPVRMLSSLPLPPSVSCRLLCLVVQLFLSSSSSISTVQASGRPSWHIQVPGLINFWERGLPWWYSGWESACQCRGHGFAPWSGRIPHAAEQLSPCATTTEACAPGARAPQREKPLQ